MNFSEIVNRLSEHCAIELIRSGDGRDVTTPALLDGTLASYEASLLYFCDRHIEFLPALCFLSEDVDLDLSDLPETTALAKIPRDQLFFAYNYVLKLLAHPDPKSFQEQLKRLLRRDCGLRQLLNFATSRLGNPIVLTDRDFKVIAHSDQLPVRDTYWRESIQRGYFNYNFLRAAHEAQLLSERGDSGTVLNGEACAHTPSPKIYCKIFQNKSLWGILTLLEDQKPLSPYHYDCLPLLSKAVEQLLPHHVPEFVANERGGSKALYDILIGAPPALVDLEASGLQSFRTYHLLCVRNTKGLSTAGLNRRILRPLNELFPRAITVFLADNLILLLPVSGEETLTSEQCEGVRQITTEACIAAGLSDCFHEISEIPWHYKQATAAIELRARLNGTDTGLAAYEDYRFVHFMQHLASDPALPAHAADFIHPALRDLHAFDLANHTEYARTLRSYLDASQSISGTAAALNLHRNSVRYRLERLSDCFPLDLTDPQLRFNIRLSFIIEDAIAAGLLS